MLIELKSFQTSPYRRFYQRDLWRSVQKKRNISWRKDQGSTIYFVKALDNGDPEVKADFRDAHQWESI